MLDSEIIEMYWSRTEEAIRATAAKYGPYCHAIAYRILYSERDAEECVNDTYFRAWQAMPPKRPNSLQTFLGCITRHLSLNRWEKLTAQKRGGGQVTRILGELTDCLPETAGPVTEDMEIVDILNRFLTNLSAEDRRLFMWRYWYMVPTADIAEAMGTTPGQVTMRLLRTREKLRHVLEKEGISL